MLTDPEDDIDRNRMYYGRFTVPLYEYPRMRAINPKV